MASEVTEVQHLVLEARALVVAPPPSQLHSPVARTPRKEVAVATTTRTRLSLRQYLEEVGPAGRMWDPHDTWLPITESREGNAWYAGFHTLSSGIGFQALALPVAFTSLGWTWGILCLTSAFCWQLYTLWLLIQLHESVPGIRHSRYLILVESTFGTKLGKFLAKFPTMYLSAGTCSALISIGGGSMKLLFNIICGPSCNSKPLTFIEWCLIFAVLAVILAQLPNLNSIAGVSFIGATTAVAYCTLIWVVSVSKGALPGASYDAIEAKSKIYRVLEILNALGIIAFAFRGHNLVLEIQGTMPSTLKHPSRVPMWRGVKFAYTLIALCLFPIAIGGFWAYGNLMPPKGILSALHHFHGQDTSRAVLGLITFLVLINTGSSFQIFAMPVFDNLESAYTSKNNKPCPQWLRSMIRVFFGSIVFLVAIAFPFILDLAGLLGGIALPVTLAYPCFMWVLIKKPEKSSAMWYTNWGLGILGMGLSVVLVVGGVWRLVETGLKIHFFKPHYM